jgi:hypothetical protein
MDLLSCEFMETTENLSDLLNMSGNDLENDLFRSTEADTDTQQSMDFYAFGFLQTSPTDNSGLLDFPLDPHALKADDEGGVFESVESDKKTDVNTADHSDSTKAKDSKHSEGNSSTAARPNVTDSPGDAVGLKPDSMNPVLFHPSPEQYNESILQNAISALQDLSTKQYYPRGDISATSSSERLHTVLSQPIPQSRSEFHSPAMRKRGLVMEGLLQTSPLSAGRRRSQSMPPAEMSFIRRLDNGDVMGIGQPVPPRPNSGRMPPRHHPYANSRRRQPTEDMYVGGHSRGVSANRAIGQHVFRSTHPGGAMTLPNSPVEHLSGNSSFKHVGLGPSYFDGAISGPSANDSDHPMHRQAGSVPLEHHRLDPITATYRFSRHMLFRLDHTINSIRKEVLMFSEDPELEM